ncbi:ALP1-like protein isoform X1 [Tanacetum coccineum]
MDLNQSDEERNTLSEVDDETYIYFMMQAYEYNEWLQQQEAQPRLTLQPDATGRMNLSVIMKCTSAIHQLAYGNTPDAFDEYLQIALIVCAGNENFVQIHDRGNTIWHVFFEVAGANNDINVLDNSLLFDDLLDDIAPIAPFVVNGVAFENCYIKKQQESARKDVERAFGVLQGRWGIIQQPARQYHVNRIRRIMYSCILMHYIILEDQEMVISDFNEMYANPSRNMQRTSIERYEIQRRKAKELQDKETHISLQRKLMEHIWQEVEDQEKEFLSSGLSDDGATFAAHFLRVFFGESTGGGSIGFCCCDGVGFDNIVVGFVKDVGIVVEVVVVRFVVDSIDIVTSDKLYWVPNGGYCKDEIKC